MALDFSLHLPNAGITSVDRHTWVYGLLGVEPRTLCTPLVSPYLLKYTCSLGVGVQKVKLVGFVPNPKLAPDGSEKLIFKPLFPRMQLSV